MLDASCSPVRMATVLTKFNYFLFFCGFLCVVSITLFLLYSRSDFAYTKSDYVANGTDRLSKTVKQQLDQFLEEHIEDPRAGETLESCADTSPKLLGPFWVDFHHNRTWNDVRKKASASLQEGGRYKPSNCISKHKVDEYPWNHDQIQFVKIKDKLRRAISYACHVCVCMI